MSKARGPDDAEKEKDLYRQNDGQTHGKARLARFVAKREHPADRANAAAENGHEKQREFRYALSAVFGAVLVDAEQSERQQVDDIKIGQYELKNIHATIIP